MFPKLATIRRKLVLLAMLASAPAVVLALGGAVLLELSAARRELAANVSVAAELVGHNSAAAIVFQEPESAKATLGSFRMAPNVVSATLFTAGGEPVAAYTRGEGAHLPRSGPDVSLVAGYTYLNDALVVVREIVVDEERVGYLVVRSDLAALGARLRQAAGTGAVALGVALLLALIVAATLQRHISGPILHLAGTARRVSEEHDYSVRAARTTRDEVGDLVDAFNQMLDRIADDTHALARARDELEARVVERTDELRRYSADLEAANESLQQESERRALVAQLATAMRGDPTVEALADAVLRTLADGLGALVGAVYLRDREAPRRLWRTVALGIEGEGAPLDGTWGLVGEAVTAGRIIEVRDAPPAYLKVRSGTGAAEPAHVVVAPFTLGGEPLGAIELAAFGPLRPDAARVLTEVAESVGVAFAACRARRHVDSLLAEAQRQAEALQRQQEELHGINAELEAKTDELMESEARLQAQQEELRCSNEELAEQSRALAAERTELAARNRELDAVRQLLEQKAADLERVSRYKSEFLANMSHELRTPLNSVLILSRLLADNRDGTLSEKQVEYGRTIAAAGEDLLALINDVLDLSKIEAGRVEVQLAPTSLADLVESARRELVPLAAERGLTLDLEVGDVPPTIRTDAQRLAQIVRNLLSNALKFTEAGRVVLRVERRDDEHVDLVVEDTGVGIAPEDQARVFEAFEQVGDARNHAGGTGLGLSICRELARLIGGEISLQSEVGRGSSFTVTLPVAGPDGAEAPVDEAPPIAPARAAATDGSLAGRTVLVVDDDVRNIYALTEVLEAEGCRVVVAENGQEALEQLEAHAEIELVVMDTMMPVMDGLAALRAMRAREEWEDMPVVALTAKAMKADREACLEAGASEYLTKPLDVDRLVSTLRAWLAGAG